MPPAGAADLLLACFAPVILQELGPGSTSRFDRPTPPDFDGSGSLEDDLRALEPAALDSLPVPLYARASSDSARLYLFYGRARGGHFADLPRGATPPWLWSDRRGGELGAPGAVVLDPAGLYRRLRAARRP
ncbi:MAG: hypothetical protein ABR599_12055 [Gemmatimonadota bacterium]